MRSPLHLLCALALGACVSADGSAQGAYQVTYDDHYFWPASMAGAPEVEVFPIVSALVVTRRDGAALTEAEEQAAFAAAKAHCAANAMAGPDGESRYAEGAWAFFSCYEL